MTAVNIRFDHPANPLSAARSAQISFQPIISMSSLRTYGFEALSILPPDSGFDNIHELMDAAAAAGQLHQTEEILLRKSLARFGSLSGNGAARLFCNFDNRVFDDPHFDPEHVVKLATEHGVLASNLCIELSERQPPQSMPALRRLVDALLRHNVRIAIDDFGRGFSGLDMLMQVNPHYVKIDRAFIEGVHASPQKQAIVGKIAGLAHSLGFLAVAEGIETDSEFRTARELGCDFAQGFLIARPTSDLSALKPAYNGALATQTVTKRISPAIAEMIRFVEPVRIGDPLSKAIERFKSREVTSLLPVVDEQDQVLGAIYESHIRYYLFGDYGAALLANRGFSRSVEHVLHRCPISEATVPAETLVDSYVVAAGNEGIALTLDGRYIGILGNHEILRLAAARDVAAARDQNALTSLPGNNSINRHLSEIFKCSQDRALVFFDFDHFKAFNDTYGFAVGDRALLIFAELLINARFAHDAFIGHVGGDDFFISMPACLADAEKIVEALCEQFSREVQSLYDPTDRRNGGIWSIDRFGDKRFFPLLRASAAMMQLPAARGHLTTGQVIAALAKGKGLAKAAASGRAVVSVPNSAVEEQLDRLLTYQGMAP